ncbi:MAG: dTDP-4-dehydrorhamnose 3,5-epimerase [Sphingomonadales bacterium]|nr:dTDP-4-dehydrorhamnose 3,5-epimerase [Sphingomonadales bacterium]
MKLTPTALPEVLLIEPRLFGDDRGFFYESWNAATFAAAGLDLAFVQDNHSRSAQGVLRGLHYQLRQPQGKLVRVVAGRAFDVAVDLRRSSPTFGYWAGAELSAASRQMLWIPPGFAHGFLALDDGTEFLYKCTAFYDQADEHCLRWDDPAVGIEWPLSGMAPVLSPKDAQGLPLDQAETWP